MALSIAQKIKVIREVEKGEKSKGDIAKEFEIPKSTLSTYLKNKDKILACAHEGVAGYKFRAKNAEFPEVEKCVLKWFRECRDGNVPLSGPVLQEKAKQFAATLGFPDFKASSGWLTKFKKRYAIVGKSVCGESASVDDTVCQDWKQNLPDLYSGYSFDEIFNADETALFYRCLPNKTISWNPYNSDHKISFFRLKICI